MGYSFQQDPYTKLLAVFNEEVAYHGLIVKNDWIEVAEPKTNGFCLKLLDRKAVEQLRQLPQLNFVQSMRHEDGDSMRKGTRIKILEKFSRAFFSEVGIYDSLQVSSIKHAHLFGAKPDRSMIARIRPDGGAYLFQPAHLSVTFSGPGHDLKPYPV